MTPSAPPLPTLSVEISIAEAGWLDAVGQPGDIAERAAMAAFEGAAGDWLTAPSAEAGIRLTGDAEVHDLNRRYRDRDQPTNVLSFPGHDEADRQRLPAGAPLMLGDVVVALETVLAEAAAEKKVPADHLSHLVVHGMLHLLGFDHMEESEAVGMERLETQILAGLGVDDPYRLVAPARSGAADLS